MRSNKLSPRFFLLALCLLLALSGCSSPSFRVGRWWESAFTSEFFGLTFKLPDGWHVATGPELVSLLGRNRIVLTEYSESALDGFEKEPDFALAYEFVTLSDDGTGRLELFYENTPVTQNSLSPSEYAEKIASDLSRYGALYGAETLSRKSVTIGGKTWAALSLDLKGKNGTLRQFYLCSERDGVMATLVYSTSDEKQELTSVLSLFN